MAGRNEKRVIEMLETLDYRLGVDFQRQHPVGERYVIDIAFLNERVAIEVDGDSHENDRMARKDRIRDRYLGSSNWVTIRVKDRDVFGEKARFYKFLIDEVVKERRAQWEIGTLFPVDFKRFIESDYE
jgi:very-short-patch-repair endonuclease